MASSGRTLQLREGALTPKRAMGKTHVRVMAARNLELGRQNALLDVDHPYQPQQQAALTMAQMADGCRLEHQTPKITPSDRWHKSLLLFVRAKIHMVLFVILFFLMWFEELIHGYTHRGEHAKFSEGELEDFLSAAFGAASRASCSIAADLSCMNIEYALAEQAHE